MYKTGVSHMTSEELIVALLELSKDLTEEEVINFAYLYPLL